MIGTSGMKRWKEHISNSTRVPSLPADLSGHLEPGQDSVGVGGME